MTSHPDAKPLFTKEQYVDDNTYYEWECKHCGKTFKSRWDAGHLIGKCDCQKLFKGYSNQEREVGEFIKTIYSEEIWFNTRKIISPYEIDIYFPNMNKGIEYNGDYWHSREGSPEHDAMKQDLCQ